MATSAGFQLGILPERKMDRRALAASYGFLVFLIIVMVNIGWIWPDSLNIKRQYHVTELIPMPSLQPKPLKMKTPPRTLRAKLLPKAPVFEAPKLTVPREIRAPRPEQPDVAPPKIEVNHFTPAVVKQVTGGARPTLIVHTGEFGSSATPTVNAPIQKVQTGGFGDPEGLKGEGKPNAHLVAASTGSFDLPPGPGNGNGAGGAKGIKGTIASAGFGNGIAQAGQGDGRSNGRGATVQTAGFSSQQFSQGSGRPQQAESGPATTPVEIISKPNPVYTEEARQLRLQGEVLLEVSFGANGQLHVNRVVRGLGHGLDEAAISAANKMRFKPAQHYNQPIDSTAIVHVVFQLAY
ncbi:MAG TPA: energy transducer TonB [Terriglobales bacterium]|nr:energy transducer TonB [Terriglobales bacterium]